MPHRYPAFPAKEPLSRRRFLGGVGVGAAFAFFPGETSAQKARVSKERARYQPYPESEERHCANCENFIPEQRRCQLVEGRISPNGHCKLFNAKSSSGMESFPETR